MEDLSLTSLPDMTKLKVAIVTTVCFNLGLAIKVIFLRRMVSATICGQELATTCVVTLPRSYTSERTGCCTEPSTT